MPGPFPAAARHLRHQRLRTDYTLAHPYDVRRNVLRIDVDRKGEMEPEGIVSLGGRWEFGP